jgi:hypothetical protein
MLEIGLDAGLPAAGRMPFGRPRRIMRFPGASRDPPGPVAAPSRHRTRHRSSERQVVVLAVERLGEVLE